MDGDTKGTIRGVIDDESLTSLQWLTSAPFPEILEQKSAEDIAVDTGEPDALAGNQIQQKRRRKNNLTILSQSQSKKSKGDRKPPYSYANLIAMALNSQDSKKLSLREIYDWISTHFPFYKKGNGAWKNSIRHNLSLSKSFVRVPREKGNQGKGGYWTLSSHEDAVPVHRSLVPQNSNKTDTHFEPGIPRSEPRKTPSPITITNTGSEVFVRDPSPHFGKNENMVDKAPLKIVSPDADADSKFSVKDAQDNMADMPLPSLSSIYPHTGDIAQDISTISRDFYKQLTSKSTIFSQISSLNHSNIEVPDKRKLEQNEEKLPSYFDTICADFSTNSFLETLNLLYNDRHDVREQTAHPDISIARIYEGTSSYRSTSSPSSPRHVPPYSSDHHFPYTAESPFYSLPPQTLRFIN